MSLIYKTRKSPFSLQEKGLGMRCIGEKGGISISAHAGSGGVSMK
jgi:hypothetical protein